MNRLIRARGETLLGASSKPVDRSVHPLVLGQEAFLVGRWRGPLEPARTESIFNGAAGPVLAWPGRDRLGSEWEGRVPARFQPNRDPMIESPGGSYNPERSK